MWTRHLITLALISAAKATDLLRLRADTIDRWFNTSGRNPPATWTVSAKADVPHPWKGIGLRGHEANIRAKVDGVPVVIKARVSQREQDTDEDTGGGAIYMELLYLEALRGRPGIPKLFGAWFDGPRVSYVVADRGEPIGALDSSGKNVTMSPASARAATARPLALARSLLECFGSWASAGYILDDFTPEQFRLDGDGLVFLVDSPTLSAQAPLGESVIRAWGRRRKQFVNAYSRTCKRDFDCPATRSELNCCDAGARGAPESKGQCNDGVCALLTEKTHVYDVAHRPWLLPFIADKATGPDRDLLVSLIRRAGAERPEDRPSFRELVDAINDAAQSDLLARAAAVDTFFTTGTAPATWDVRRPSDVPQPWHEIGNQSIAKRVFRARVGSRNVIVKARAGDPRDPRATDTAGGTLYMELAWLAALRGRRGIPELHGAWFDGPRVTYVVGDAGEPIGVGPSGAGTEPTVMSHAFSNRAKAHPLQQARSLFMSWTSAGYLQDDFKAQQFTMDSKGVIYLVDGPRAFRSSPLGRAISRPYGHHAEKRLVSTKIRGCERDADCPSTRDNHACHDGACEAGARGAPEARGKCQNNACWVLSDKTHVWDVANRPWLLPFIAERAKDPEERDLLRSLIRRASAEAPEDRPSFGELVERIDLATRLARAKAFDAWWNGTAAAPDAWTVSGKDDVPEPWRALGSREVNLQKHVYRAAVGGRAVVVKTTKHAEAVDSRRGGTLYLEMLYLEILRGRPGVPELLGAWFDGHLITYVVADAGTAIGEGTVDDGRKARARAGLSTAQPTVLSTAFTRRAEKQPLALARSLLACFQSWASVGFVQDDFKAQQFTMDADGAIFLVDGPRLLANAPLRRAMVNSWGRWPEKKHMNSFARTCERDSDCPYSKDHKHCCRDPGNCEAGARGAPESKGKCGGDGVCLLLSERTHVYDVANRPWLLPFIADKATGDVRDFLRDLIRRASAELPEDRPSFEELLDRIDEFENRRRDTTESVPPSPPRETTRLEAHAAGEAPDAKTLLARASLIDHWFQTKKGNRPSTWTVWKPDQVPGPWRTIDHHTTTNKKKHIYLSRVSGVPVVIKTRHSGTDLCGNQPSSRRRVDGGKVVTSAANFDFYTGTDVGGGTLYMEMLYMEVLRGLPGIPYLYGAWSGEHRVSYVVKDCGAPIGLGPSGAGTEPTVMSPAYNERAKHHPIQLARSLLVCFQSWASAGYIQDDFKAQQFTMDASTGDIYLVDGPRALYNSPLGQSMVRVWGDWRRKGLINADAPDACENDEDCPSTLDFHSCVPEESCPEGTRGAPESKGECRDGACVLISEKTHVFDSANRPWLLPFIANKATGAERDILLTLIRHASAHQPEHRPSFAEMVDHLDRFEHQKRGN